MHAPLLLLDADVLAYKLAARAQQTLLFEAPEGGRVAPQTTVDADALEAGAYSDVAAAVNQAGGASWTVACFSCPTEEGWRRALYPQYKAQRGAKPLLLEAAKRAIGAQCHEVFRRPGLEADDIMGLLATHPRQFKEFSKRIIVSIDKDMRSVPGLLFNPDKGFLEEITREDAEYQHMYQTLVGDSTDNYPGARGIGPKRAEALLGQDRSWDAVRSCFASEDDFLLQARLARILRHGDYDYKARKVKLWNPPAK